jgi:hypothetical protein
MKHNNIEDLIKALIEESIKKYGPPPRDNIEIEYDDGTKKVIKDPFKHIYDILEEDNT